MALTKPFAVNGDKTPIKLDTTADGVVNYENGFGARYSMPIKAVIDSGGNITKTGGLQIERGQMNQILNDFSSAIIENQENIGVLSSLQTTAKDNLVGAINENFSNIQVNKNSINSIKGQISTTNNNIGTLSNLTTTNKSNIVSAINEVNNTTSKLLTRNINWSVGTGGNFTDLGSALLEASKYKQTGLFRIVITLLNNLTLSKTVAVPYNLPNVILDGNNFRIDIMDKTCFNAYKHNGMLVIKNLIINNTGSNTGGSNFIGGIFIDNFGVINIGENVTITNFKNGILCGTASIANAKFAANLKIEGCYIGLSCFANGLIIAYNTLIKDATNGLVVWENGGISVGSPTFKNVKIETNIPVNTAGNSAGYIAKF